ncbi:hypothetical protein L195_g017147, partial [Trifolium pratense]
RDEMEGTRNIIGGTTGQSITDRRVLTARELSERVAPSHDS